MSVGVENASFAFYQYPSSPENIPNLWIFHPGETFIVNGVNLLTFKALPPFKTEKEYKKCFLTPKGDSILTYTASRLSVFKTSTYQQGEAKFVLSQEPTLFKFSLSGKYLFIEEGRDTALHCFNLQKLQKEKIIQKDNKFEKIFFTVDEKFALALYNGWQSLSILNLSSLKIEKNLDLPGKKGYAQFHFIAPYLLIEKRDTFSLLKFNFNYLMVENIFKDHPGSCKIQGSKAFIFEASLTPFTLKEFDLITHRQMKIELEEVGSLFAVSPFHPYIFFTYVDWEDVNHDFSEHYYYTPRQLTLLHHEKGQPICLKLDYKVQGVHFFGKEQVGVSSSLQKMLSSQYFKRLTDLRFIL